MSDDFREVRGIGAQTSLRGRLPQLEIKSSHGHRRPQRVLPEERCGQMHGIVAPQLILPGQLIGTGLSPQ